MDKKLRVISFLDYSDYNNIYNEFVDSDSVVYYSCFIDTLDKNESFRINNLIIEKNRINDLRHQSSVTVPISLMKRIYSNYLQILLRITDRYSDMLGISKTFQAVEAKALELIDYCYNFINERYPDVVLYYDIPHLPIEYCIYFLAKEMNIDTKILFSMVLSRLDDRTLRPVKLISEINANPFTHLNLNNNSYEYSAESLSSTYVSPKTKQVSSKRFFRKMIFLIKSLFDLSEREFLVRTVYYSVIHRIRSISNLIINSYRLNSYKRFVKSSNNIILSDYIYYYFPLHLQPEASTQARTSFFQDQLYVIKLVSAELPDGIKLVVKEHPAYFLKNLSEGLKFYRNKSFYESLQKLNNVLLVNYLKSSEEIIKYSLGVVSIAGSVIFEAYRYGKPALVFGNTSYSHLPNVTSVTNGNDIFGFFRTALDLDLNNGSSQEKNEYDKLLSGFTFVNYYDISSKYKESKIIINKKIARLILESLIPSSNDT